MFSFGILGNLVGAIEKKSEKLDNLKKSISKLQKGIFIFHKNLEFANFNLGYMNKLLRSVLINYFFVTFRFQDLGLPNVYLSPNGDLTTFPHFFPFSSVILLSRFTPVDRIDSILAFREPGSPPLRL